MLRKLFALVCVLSLSACGLKGSLYMPDKTPVPAPMSTPSAQSPTASDTTTP